MANRKTSIKGKKSGSIRVTRGSGNVFKDLGFKDADELEVKAELTRELSRRIKSLCLTQVEAGKRFGIGQPDVSRLMKGRYTGFSIERLLTFLNALAVDVEIILHPGPKTGSQGTVTVMKVAA